MYPDAPGDAFRSFVGRKAELEFLTAAAHDAGCRGVLVLGDFGSGKTALMRVFADRLSRAGEAVFYTPLRQYPDAEELFFHLARAIDEHSPATSLRPPVRAGSVHPRLYSDSLLSDLRLQLSEIGNFHLFLDGLDEFRDPARLTRALRDLVESTPEGIKLYITSRSSVELRWFNDAPIKVLRLGSLTQADVADFVKRTIEAPAWSDPRILNSLLAWAKGSPLLLSMLLEIGKDVDLTLFLREPEQDVLRDVIHHLHKRELSRLDPAHHIALNQLLFTLSGYDRHSLSMRFLATLFGESKLKNVIPFSNIFLSRQEERTGNAIQFSHFVFKEFYRDYFARKFPIDPQSFYFGAEEAERDKKLENQSIDPPILDDILSGTKSIILGDRGSGKSALVQILRMRGGRDFSQEYSDGDIVVVSPLAELFAFGKRYDPKHDTTCLTAEGFKDLWLLYFAESVVQFTFRLLKRRSIREPAMIRKFLLRQSPEVLRAAAATRVGRTLVWLVDKV